MDQDKFAVTGSTGACSTRKTCHQEMSTGACNNGLSKKSFFRLDKNYAPREYDKTNKVLPPSQSDSTSQLNENIIFQCEHCNKKCKSQPGLKRHQRTCMKSSNEIITNITTSSVTNSQPLEHNSSQREREENWEATAITETSHLEFQIEDAYEHIISWRRNIFPLPKGSIGKQFVQEMTRMLTAWNTNSSSKKTALKSLMIFPSLMLQKTNAKLKSSENKECLARRLDMWKENKISELLFECKEIQRRLTKEYENYNKQQNIARRFSNMMKNGKVNSALNLLSDTGFKGILPLDDSTFQILQSKHPEGSYKNENLLIEGPIKKTCAVIYDQITGDLIKKCALRTKGAAGPSCFDGDDWRRIIGTNIYGADGNDLRKAIAETTRQLCIDELDSHSLKSIESLMACRLIPLNKNPGVRPIGIGEVLRRIMGKAVMTIFKKDVMEVAGPSQLCTGHQAGCEAAVHSVVETFNVEVDAEGVLQVDAANAFNKINRKVMLHNIKILCPYLSAYVYNSYALPARLFIQGGKELRSLEGTTQGDPIASSIYAIGILPLLSLIIFNQNQHSSKFLQVAFADDVSGTGKLLHLKQWWQDLVKHGPTIGYFPNGGKSWLTVKPLLLETAIKIFSDTLINITCEGRRHLGACIGSENYKNVYMKEKVNAWVQEINTLADIARSEPHCALTAFTHGLRNRYTYFMRTIPDIKEQLQPLENAIRYKLLPELLEGHQCNDKERQLLALPPKFGGIGIINPIDIAANEYINSKKLTETLTNSLKSQQHVYIENQSTLKTIKIEIQAEKERHYTSVYDTIRNNTNDQSKLKLLESSIEQGAYNWLTSLPLVSYNYYLDKRTFWDSIRTRYNLPIKRLPDKCVCSKPFDVEHALNCKKGGFITNRHNSVRDITANLLQEITNDVQIEPILEPRTGEVFQRSVNTSENARVDIAARSIWIRGQRAYFDVRVFNPLARTYRDHSLRKAYEKNEMEKKRHYNERILQIEHGSFTPLIFSTTGGMGREASTFYSKVAEKIAEKRDITKSEAVTFIRTTMSFALLRATNLCIRGSRSHKQNIMNTQEVDIGLVNHESQCISK